MPNAVYELISVLKSDLYSVAAEIRQNLATKAYHVSLRDTDADEIDADEIVGVMIFPEDMFDKMVIYAKTLI